MGLPEKSPSRAATFVRSLVDMSMAPLSPKNLRLSATLIAIYQLLLAHLLVFLVLLALGHAEQMKALLALDIEDQKDTGFYDMSPFRNQLRLQNATQLVEVTEMLLYILTGVAFVFLFCSISLCAGVYKNRAEFLLPWLMVDFIFLVAALVLVIWLQDEKLVQILCDKMYYFAICFSLIVCDSLMWYTIHTFYQSLRTMNKLREIATVAIPCPPPGAIPFHFQRENMYLGSNGYKHILTESPDGNY